MRFFFLKDYQDWLLSVGLGLILVILIYLALKSYNYSQERIRGREQEEFHYPDGIEGRNFPTPPFMIFLYIGFVIWAVCYVIFIGMKGPI